MSLLFCQICDSDSIKPLVLILLLLLVAQSYLWNAAASHRIERHGAGTVIAGDLVLPAVAAAAAGVLLHRLLRLGRFSRRVACLDPSSPFYCHTFMHWQARGNLALDQEFTALNHSESQFSRPTSWDLRRWNCPAEQTPKTLVRSPG